MVLHSGGQLSAHAGESVSITTEDVDIGVGAALNVVANERADLWTNTATISAIDELDVHVGKLIGTATNGVVLASHGSAQLSVKDDVAVDVVSLVSAVDEEMTLSVGEKMTLRVAGGMDMMSGDDVFMVADGDLSLSSASVMVESVGAGTFMLESIGLTVQEGVTVSSGDVSVAMGSVVASTDQVDMTVAGSSGVEFGQDFTINAGTDLKVFSKDTVSLGASVIDLTAADRAQVFGDKVEVTGKSGVKIASQGTGIDLSPRSDRSFHAITAPIPRSFDAFDFQIPLIDSVIAFDLTGAIRIRGPTTAYIKIQDSATLEWITLWKMAFAGEEEYAFPGLQAALNNSIGLSAVRLDCTVTHNPTFKAADGFMTVGVHQVSERDTAFPCTPAAASLPKTNACACAGPPPHGLSSNTMALITTDRAAMRPCAPNGLRTKWP